MSRARAERAGSSATTRKLAVTLASRPRASCRGGTTRSRSKCRPSSARRSRTLRRERWNSIAGSLQAEGAASASRNNRVSDDGRHRASPAGVVFGAAGLTLRPQLAVQRRAPHAEPLRGLVHVAASRARARAGSPRPPRAPRALRRSPACRSSETWNSSGSTARSSSGPTHPAPRRDAGTSTAARSIAFSSSRTFPGQA